MLRATAILAVLLAASTAEARGLFQAAPAAKPAAPAVEVVPAAPKAPAAPAAAPAGVEVVPAAKAPAAVPGVEVIPAAPKAAPAAAAPPAAPAAAPAQAPFVPPGGAVVPAPSGAPVPADALGQGIYVMGDGQKADAPAAAAPAPAPAAPKPAVTVAPAAAGAAGPAAANPAPAKPAEGKDLLVIMTVDGASQANVYNNQGVLRSKVAAAAGVPESKVLFYDVQERVDPRTKVAVTTLTLQIACSDTSECGAAGLKLFDTANQANLTTTLAREAGVSVLPSTFQVYGSNLGRRGSEKLAAPARPISPLANLEGIQMAPLNASMAAPATPAAGPQTAADADPFAALNPPPEAPAAAAAPANLSTAVSLPEIPAAGAMNVKSAAGGRAAAGAASLLAAAAAAAMLL